MAKTSPAFGEEEDPSSRYQNPRYSGKSIPDRGSSQKRKVTWDVHDTNTGKYMYSVRGGERAPKRHAIVDREVSREGHSAYGTPTNRKYKK